MDRAIVTGATGGVGLALVNELLRSGKQVVAVIRPNSRRKDRLPQHEALRVIECELDSMTTLPKYIGTSPCGTFYQLGWDYSRAHNDVEKQLHNVGCTLKAIDAASRLGCTSFIGAGSQAEFGLVDGVIDESTLPCPVTAYGAAKLSAGQIGRILCEKKGMRFVWPRIFSVYGPGDGDATVLMTVIRKLLRGETPALTAGEQIWDFLYVSDVAVALRLLGETERCAGIYCVGNGETRQLKSFIEELRDQIDPQAKMNFGAVPYGEKQVMNLRPDISRLRRDTGFEPEVSFAEGIRKTIAWCREHPNVYMAGYGASR